MDAQRGYTYLGLLFAVAFLGLLLAGAGEVWRLTAQREKEEQLLFVGHEFSRALAAYHAATPAEPKQWPHRLEDLVEDTRGGSLRRHLRRIHIDPLTGTRDWGLVMAGPGIAGVYSRGSGEPLKRANFLPGQEELAGAATYADWVFRPMAGGQKQTGSP